jgi:ankyrin repeat protein
MLNSVGKMMEGIDNKQLTALSQAGSVEPTVNEGERVSNMSHSASTSRKRLGTSQEGEPPSKRIPVAPAYRFNNPIFYEKHEDRGPREIVREIGKYLTLSDVMNVSLVRKSATHLGNELWDWKSLGWNSFDDFRKTFGVFTDNLRSDPGQDRGIATNLTRTTEWKQFIKEVRALRQQNFVPPEIRIFLSALHWLDQGKMPSHWQDGDATKRGVLSAPYEGDNQQAFDLFEFSKRLFSFDYFRLTDVGQKMFFKAFESPHFACALMMAPSAGSSSTSVGPVTFSANQAAHRLVNRIANVMHAWVACFDDTRMLEALSKLVAPDWFEPLVRTQHVLRRTDTGYDTNELIHVAALYRRNDVLEYLLNRCSPSIYNYGVDGSLIHYLTAYFNVDGLKIMAGRLQDHEIQTFLSREVIDSGTESLTPLQRAVCAPNFDSVPNLHSVEARAQAKREVAELLLDMGACCLTKNVDGWNAFHYLAASEPSVEIAMSMFRSLDSDADRFDLLISTTRCGNTPLNLAARSGMQSIEFLEWLVGQGSLPFIANEDGDTALHTLARSGDAGSTAASVVVKRLLPNEIKTLLAKQNVNGDTVADVAKLCGDTELYDWCQRMAAG